jgi:isopenicillin N synthase-like dioxygenase
MVETIADNDVAIYADFDNRYRTQRVRRDDLAALPTIDIATFRTGDAAARTRVAAEIRNACISIGFFYLTGHGFARAEVDELFMRGHHFFALPIDEKAKIHWNLRSGKGYIPPGGINATADSEKTADRKERLYFAKEFAVDESEAARYPSDSQWPDERALPGFQHFIKTITRKSIALAQSLGEAFAQSLALPAGYFNEAYGRFGGTLVYNYYPPIDPQSLSETQWSFSPHTDYGSFTVLFQDQNGGLQVRNASGHWIDVTPVPGALVVNIGDMLAMATNDLYTSNLHRVLNSAGHERLSVSLFVSPAAETMLRCIETCTDADHPPRYEPTKAGDYHRILMEQYHRTGRPGLAVRTASRLHTQ